MLDSQMFVGMNGQITNECRKWTEENLLTETVWKAKSESLKKKKKIRKMAAASSPLNLKPQRSKKHTSGSSWKGITIQLNINVCLHPLLLHTVFVQKSRSPSGQNISIASIYQRRTTKLTGSHYIQEQTSVCCYISPGSIAPGNKP